MARRSDILWILGALVLFVVGMLSGIWIILLPIGAIAGLIGIRRSQRL